MKEIGIELRNGYFNFYINSIPIIINETKNKKTQKTQTQGQKIISQLCDALYS